MSTLIIKSVLGSARYTGIRVIRVENRVIKHKTPKTNDVEQSIRDEKNNYKLLWSYMEWEYVIKVVCQHPEMPREYKLKRLYSTMPERTKTGIRRKFDLISMAIHKLGINKPYNQLTGIDIDSIIKLSKRINYGYVEKCINQIKK